MASLRKLASGRFKRKRSTRKSNNMARRKTRRRRSPMRRAAPRRRSSRGRSILSSGSGLIRRIPIIGRAVTNPIIGNALKGLGAVVALTAIATTVNNPTINRFAFNPLARAGTAFLVGDFGGGIAQFAMDRRFMSQSSNGRQSDIISVAGNGVA